MQVKCAWVTCKHNTENVSYCNNRGHDRLGYCTSETGEIILDADIECESCNDKIDGLNCKTYESRIVIDLTTFKR